MRFMMLMIPKGYESADAGAMPNAEHVAAMMKYNEELQKAGKHAVLMGVKSGQQTRFVALPLANG